MITTSQDLLNFPRKHTLSDLGVDYFVVDVLGQDYINLNEAINILSPSEDSRRKKFKTEKLRNRFAIRTAMFRILLANQLNCPIEDLSISQNKYGKPYIEDSGLYFNASYSNELAVYAFSSREELGVDIEKVVPFPDEMETAKHVMTPDEYSLYHCLDGELATEFFYRLWTAKEAYMKLLGVGLYLEPRNISLEFTNTTPGIAQTADYPNAEINYLSKGISENYIISLALLT